MNFLIDKPLTNNLVYIAKMVLEKHFFYSKEESEKFICELAENINHEHACLSMQVDNDFKRIMKFNTEARKIFTAKFCSYHLMKTLDEQLHFNDPELELFEEMLLKYVYE